LKALLLGTDPSSIDVASEMVRRGGTVAYPTDTVYGLGCDPFNPDALERLVGVKERESKPISVICANEEEAASLVRLSARALALAHRYWPGPLTIVAPLKREVPALLNQGTRWLGVRVPDDRTALALASGCGGVITGTSANLSGRPPARSAGDVAESLGDRIDAILDGGGRRGPESTVVRVEEEAVEVLRRGAVAFGPEITRERLDR
jgi:L-threonylcarbamoyladenylate synthase